MTPHELIIKLASQEGPCMRTCAYCPEEHDTAEIKECVEGMYKEIYKLQMDKDELLNDIIKLRNAYKEVTGFDYRDS